MSRIFHDLPQLRFALPETVFYNKCKYIGQHVAVASVGPCMFCCDLWRLLLAPKIAAKHLTGQRIEVSVRVYGTHGGSPMPYKSDAQRRYFNVPENRNKLEAQGVDVDEWNESSKGKKLPEKVKEARCWEGYEPVSGKKPYSEDSCQPVGTKKKKTDEKSASALGRLAAGVANVGNNLSAEDVALGLPVIGAGLGAGAGNLVHRLAGVISPQEDEEARKASRRQATLTGAGVGLGLGTRGLMGALKGKIDQMKHDAAHQRPQAKLASDITKLAESIERLVLQHRATKEKQASEFRIKMARLILTKAALRKMAEVEMEMGTQCKTCGKAKCTCGRTPSPMHDLARGGARPG